MKAINDIRTETTAKKYLEGCVKERAIQEERLNRYKGLLLQENGMDAKDREFALVHYDMARDELCRIEDYAQRLASKFGLTYL